VKNLKGLCFISEAASRYSSASRLALSSLKIFWMQGCITVELISLKDQNTDGEPS
jgi:hypothetical protein